ncbi:MAG: energy transducer TonB [Novosphingobium sp.]|nr:energy transducer TonB [Novosphingobium sp.]
MAYVQAQSPRRRAAMLGGVAALHVAAVYALLSGFAVAVWERVDDELEARHIPADPPPPEPVIEPVRDPLETQLVAPKPRLVLDRTPSEATIVDLIPITPTPLPTTPAVESLPARPSPTPSFALQGARPLGSPGKWATTEDYPARALREGREGTTRFRVTVGLDGRVRNCEVTSSSGSSDLDRATCENVARRARFKPATDATGSAVAGSYTNAVRWEIPDWR